MKSFITVSLVVIMIGLYSIGLYSIASNLQNIQFKQVHINEVIK